MKTQFYDVLFNSKTSTLAESSRLFNTKRAAIRWARYLAKQHYVSTAQVWIAGAGGQLVFEVHNKSI